MSLFLFILHKINFTSPPSSQGSSSSFVCISAAFPPFLPSSPGCHETFIPFCLFGFACFFIFCHNFSFSFRCTMFCYLLLIVKCEFADYCVIFADAFNNKAPKIRQANDPRIKEKQSDK